MKDNLLIYEWPAYILWSCVMYFLIQQFGHNFQEYMNIVWATYLSFIVLGVFYLERDWLFPDEKIPI